MKMINLIALILVLMTSTAFAASTRSWTFDTSKSSDGTKVYSYPAASDTIVGRISTDTLTNKTMSGASNTFSAIPVGSIGNGSVLSGSNTGDVTIGTANGLSLSGQALSLQAADASHNGALTQSDWTLFNGKLSSALTTNHIFVGASGVATDVAMSGDASIVASGALTLATVNSNVGSFTNANITVNAKGLVTAASNGSSGSPSLNGGSGSPQSVTAAGGISLSSIASFNHVWVVGNAGAVTVTATPSITACTADGQMLFIHGTDATNTVTLQDEAGLSGSKLELNGNVTLGLNQSITLHCDITQVRWIEDSRSN